MDSKLDEELLTGYISTLGVNIVEQMITLYQQQSSIYLQDISDAVETDSQSLWQEHCHKMKGAAGSVGLITLHAMLVKIEKSTASMADKKQFLIKLEQENSIALQAFYDWLAKQS